jgi:hypothetical protein
MTPERRAYEFKSGRELNNERDGRSMFKSRFIRNAGGLVAGRIDEDDHGSRAYDAGGTFVGRYNRFSDRTVDSRGQVFKLSGDVLTALIFGKKIHGDQDLQDSS